MKKMAERSYEAFDGKRFKEYGVCLAYESLHTWITDHVHSGITFYDYNIEPLSWIGGPDVDIEEVRKYYEESIHFIVIREEDDLSTFNLHSLWFVADKFNWHLILKYVKSKGTWERRHAKGPEDNSFESVVGGYL